MCLCSTTGMLPDDLLIPKPIIAARPREACDSQESAQARRSNCCRSHSCQILFRLARLVHRFAVIKISILRFSSRTTLQFQLLVERTTGFQICRTSSPWTSGRTLWPTPKAICCPKTTALLLYERRLLASIWCLMTVSIPSIYYRIGQLRQSQQAQTCKTLEQPSRSSQFIVLMSKAGCSRTRVFSN